MSKSNVELARQGYEAALRGDFDAVREFLHPDVKWHGGDPSAPGACRNREQALEFMRQAHTRRRLGDLVELVDAGEKVVVIMRTAPYGDEPGVLTANLTTLRDGKAIEMVHYPDPADALAAAGGARHYSASRGLKAVAASRGAERAGCEPVTARGPARSTWRGER